MCLCTKVVVVWRGLRERERRIMQAMSRGSGDAVLRFRCKVVLALVQGKSPTSIEEGGCAPLPRVIELPIASSTMVLKDCLIGGRTTARTRSRSFKSWDCCPS